jgi:hypothetical protein
MTEIEVRLERILALAESLADRRSLRSATSLQDHREDPNSRIDSRIRFLESAARRLEAGGDHEMAKRYRETAAIARHRRWLG